MTAVNVQVRVDQELVEKAKLVTKNMGFDVSTAIRMFLSQLVNENRLPFTPSCDPFYSEKNIAALKNSIEQIKKGQVVSKTIDELRAMEK